VNVQMSVGDGAATVSTTSVAPHEQLPVEPIKPLRVPVFVGGSNRSLVDVAVPALDQPATEFQARLRDWLESGESSDDFSRRQVGHLSVIVPRADLAFEP
jgi:hypothetical protein